MWQVWDGRLIQIGRGVRANADQPTVKTQTTRVVNGGDPNHCASTAGRMSSIFSLDPLNHVARRAYGKSLH
jgi:hypothetical protein